MDTEFFAHDLQMIFDGGRFDLEQHRRFFNGLSSREPFQALNLTQAE